MKRKKKHSSGLPSGRKSYYGFVRDYPGNEPIDSGYKSDVEKKHRRTSIVRWVFAAVGFVFVFVVGYFAATLMLDVSNLPLVAETQPAETETAAGGAEPATEPETTDTGSNGRNAIYLPVSALADTDALNARLDSAAAAGINAVVLDIKNEDGTVNYATAVPEALTAEAAAAGVNLLPAIDAVRQHGMAVIGRFNCFNDPLAASAFSDAAVHYMGTDQLWLDTSPEKGGKAWLNPYSDAARSYNVDIIREAFSTLNLDKVLLTGVQFPDGFSLEKASFDGEDSSSVGRNETLKSFVDLVLDAVGGADKIILCVTGDSALNGDAARYDGSLLDSSARVCAPDLRQGELPDPMTVGDQELSPAADMNALISAACRQIVSRATLGGRSVGIMPVLDVQDGQPASAYIQAAEAAGVSGYILWNDAGNYTF